jgi:dTMP kinase
MTARIGQFLSIEGIEGAGKTTVVQFIRDFLLSHHVNVYFTREPGGTPLAEKIRDLLLHSSDEAVQVTTELLLMFAARAEHLAFIKPRLQQGQWVVTDRFIDASYAYQAGGRGISESFIQALDHFVVNECYPQLTLLLDLPPALGLERAKSRGNQPDRIERERVDFFERVRSVYLARYEADPARIHLINAALPLPDVLKQVENVLTTFMATLS